MTESLPTLLIIPTGIGCSFGGYAGDAIPVARLLANASGCLITHPNVMNGASLYWNDKRIQYVEGYSLDRFAAGQILLRPVRQQKVGLLLDAGIEEELKQYHLQVVDACRATLGINVGPVSITEEPLNISLIRGSSGASWGELENPEVLLKAGENLKNEGATAIAVVTRFPEDCDAANIDKYRRGVGVDPLAGVEAVISHLLVKHLCIPSAHAPAMTPLPNSGMWDPRTAAEDLGNTFLPCVLVGLSRAPDLISVINDESFDRIQVSCCHHVNGLGAVIAPSSAVGSESVLACLERNIPLIVVSNPGVVNVSLQDLGFIDETFNFDRPIFFADNYLEAAGLINMIKEGLSIESLKRPISRMSVK